VNVKPKFDIRAHFDSVRDMIYVNQLNIIAHVADDSQIKLWSLKNIKKQFDSEKGQLESFATLRGHKGALTSITGPSLQNTDVSRNVSKLIFTAGHEGIIRAWNIPEFRGSDEKYPTTNG
jgi:WD40 repeat protein